eukprot:scaffold40313_cov25-Prasinocladus_malaysianus.AAC.1
MFRGSGSGPPVDFGGDLQRAQSILTKYSKKVTPDLVPPRIRTEGHTGGRTWAPMLALFYSEARCGLVAHISRNQLHWR